MAMVTITRHLLSIVLLLALLAQVHGDCGCGMRCQKYTNELQCGRCCTATVRRSAPMLQTFDQPDKLMQKQLQSSRKQSLAELSSILSLLEQKERRSSSKKVRAELHRTRKRLEKYGQVRYGDLINDGSNSSGEARQFSKDEQEMYDMLERILQRLVRQYQTDDDSRLEKREADKFETPAQKTDTRRFSRMLSR